MFWNNKSSRDRSAPSVARSGPKPAPVQVHMHVQKNSALSLDAHSLKPLKPERNSDPYNTSGSFDRTKNWSRVGKR
jgi:hypothetical protein